MTRKRGLTFTFQSAPFHLSFGIRIRRFVISGSILGDIVVRQLLSVPVISGIIISYTGWYIFDPVIGIVISVVILISSIRLLHDSLRLSLDGVPEGIDIEQLRQRLLASDPRIQGIHHLHVWAISTTENSLTAHIVTEDIQHAAEIKHALHERLKQEGILHATLEFERPEETCDAPECDCGREH